MVIFHGYIRLPDVMGEVIIRKLPDILPDILIFTILDYLLKMMIIQIPHFAQGPVVISFRSTGVARLSDRTSTGHHLVYIYNIYMYIYIYMIFG